MGKGNITVVGNSKLQALSEISEKFGVVETVKTLRGMMQEVIKTEITPDTVNAACNCAQSINLTIKTSVQAARFVSDMRDDE